jgi:hypothetical protein
VTTLAWTRLATLAVLILASGCASVPPGSDALALQARRFTPPPGKANLYAVRMWSVFESGIVWPVTLDFKEFGNVGQRSYLYGAISPGEHVLGANLPGPVPNRVKFTAEAGRNHFFKLSPTPGWLAGMIRIELLDEETGRALIERYTLSADNRFELEQ